MESSIAHVLGLLAQFTLAYFAVSCLLGLAWILFVELSLLARRLVRRLRGVTDRD